MCKATQDMTEDMQYQAKVAGGTDALTDDIRNAALLDIEATLMARGKTLADYPDMPQPDRTQVPTPIDDACITDPDELSDRVR